MTLSVCAKRPTFTASVNASCAHPGAGLLLSAIIARRLSSGSEDAMLFKVAPAGMVALCLWITSKAAVTSFVVPLGSLRGQPKRAALG